MSDKPTVSEAVLDLLSVAESYHAADLTVAAAQLQEAMDEVDRAVVRAVRRHAPDPEVYT